MLAFLVPKVYLGVKTMCKKFHKVCSLGCDLLRVTVLRFSLSPSNAVTAVVRFRGILGPFELNYLFPISTQNIRFNF